MPELRKFLSIFLIIPINSAVVERRFFALKRIKLYTQNTIGQNRDDNVSLIIIEKELVKSIAQNEKLYDVIDHFNTILLKLKIDENLLFSKQNELLFYI